MLRTICEPSKSVISDRLRVQTDIITVHPQSLNKNLTLYILLDFWATYVLKVEAASFSKLPPVIYQSTRCQIHKTNLHQRLCEIVKSNNIITFGCKFSVSSNHIGVRSKFCCAEKEKLGTVLGSYKYYIIFFKHTKFYCPIFYLI